MKLCLITPPAFVEATGILPGRFCLAQIALHNEKYRQYFKDAASNDFEVILDNGAYENDCLSPEILIDLAHEIRPAVVVLPDLLDADPMKNLKYAEKAYDIWDNCGLPLGCAAMFVPQCPPNPSEEDHFNFTDSVARAIGCEMATWVGIGPHAARNVYGGTTGSKDQMIHKLAFMQEFNDCINLGNCNTKVHSLGIGNHYGLLPALRDAGFHSADTASFFWQSWRGLAAHPYGAFPNDASRPEDYFALTPKHIAEDASGGFRNLLVSNCKLIEGQFDEPLEG